MMDWIETTESSNIARLRYDEACQALFVEFRSGGIYQYFDVPLGVFEQLRSAPSKGQFLAQSIKGAYRYART